MRWQGLPVTRPLLPCCWLESLLPSAFSRSREAYIGTGAGASLTPEWRHDGRPCVARTVLIKQSSGFPYEQRSSLGAAYSLINILHGLMLESISCLCWYLKSSNTTSWIPLFKKNFKCRYLLSCNIVKRSTPHNIIHYHTLYAPTEVFMHKYWIYTHVPNFQPINGEETKIFNKLFIFHTLWYKWCIWYFHLSITYLHLHRIWYQSKCFMVACTCVCGR